MELVENDSTGRSGNLARTLLVLDNFEWIKRQAESVGVTVIPIKGIDVLTSIYSEQLDRDVRDIDLLTSSVDDCLKLVERLCDNGYEPEFDFAVRRNALFAKKKISLLSTSPCRVNVDIHFALVTKKFFSLTTSTFNVDAFARQKSGRLDSVDNWLFLAQHGCFHLFSDSKWIRDLDIIYQSFTDDERRMLSERIEQYGFKRVWLAALSFLKQDLRQCGMGDDESSFVEFVTHLSSIRKKSPAKKLALSFLEFFFIADRQLRVGSWLKLIFPRRGMLANIYRINHKALYPLFWVAHVALMAITVPAARAVFRFHNYLLR